MGKLEVPLAYGWKVTERCFGSEKCEVCERLLLNSNRFHEDRYFLEFTNIHSLNSKVIVLIMFNPSDAGKRSQTFNESTNELYYVSDSSVNLFLQSLLMKVPCKYGKVAVINMYPHIESNSDKMIKKYKSDEIVENNLRIITAHLKKYDRKFDIYEATGLVDAEKRYDKFINKIKTATNGASFGIKFGIEIEGKKVKKHIHQRIDTRKQLLNIKKSLK